LGSSEVAEERDRDGSLSPPHRQRLRELEEVIDEGLAIFVRVGRALQEIRDRRLYRESHSSFDDYCRQRFGLGRHWAYRQMRGAEVTALLEDVDSCQQTERLPANEAQARPLTGVDPDEARRAWSLAIEMAEGSQPTSNEVRAAVRRITGTGSEVTSSEGNASVHFSSGTDVWLTPPGIIERVQEVVGRIDLDPCAASRSSPAVPADTHLTEAEDGLNHRWSGTVYLNPPYGREVGTWVEKLVGSYESGSPASVQEAVALSPARTDTRWFRRLRPYPKCFVHGRLKFSDSDQAAPFPSMTVYLGPEPKTFVAVFSEIGDIYVAVDGSPG
jgi:hypothetical protein